MLVSCRYKTELNDSLNGYIALFLFSVKSILAPRSVALNSSCCLFVTSGSGNLLGLFNKQFPLFSCNNVKNIELLAREILPLVQPLLWNRNKLAEKTAYFLLVSEETGVFRLILFFAICLSLSSSINADWSLQLHDYERSLDGISFSKELSTDTEA